MANLESFGSYSELLKYYRSIGLEIANIEKLLEEREKEILAYYRNVRKETLKEWIEREKESKRNKDYGSMSAIQTFMESNSVNLIEYKDYILKEWENNFYGDEELYCYLEYLKNEQKKFEPTLNQGSSRFNKNVVKSITKNYIFERIHDCDELLSYMDGLHKERGILEKEISSSKKFIDKTKSYKCYSKLMSDGPIIPAEHLEEAMVSGEYYTGEEDFDILSPSYRAYLKKEYLESETYLALKASLFSIYYEIGELSGITKLIKHFKEDAETSFYDQTIDKLSNQIYAEYRTMMLKRYTAKRSMEAYNRYYNQEIIDNANACKTLERIATDAINL